MIPAAAQPSDSILVERLIALSSRIIKGATLEDALEFIFREFHTIVPYDRIGFAEIDGDNGMVTSRWARSRRSPRLRIGYSAPLAGSSLSLVLELRKPRVMNDLLTYLKRHPKSTSTQLITSEGVRSSMTCPLFIDDKPYGFLFFSSEEPGTYSDFHVDVLKEISNQLALLLMTSQLEPAPVQMPSGPFGEEETRTNIKLSELMPGMIVDAPVVLDNGRLFVAAGVELTWQSISRLITLEMQGFFAVGTVAIR